ncbi:AAA family ATPase [Mycobacteroides abscessus]|uniref:AAA family ATPase n=1 Tax=Mycobacteroides abscessus TaxID=36809 RepID=UPI00266C1C20|nr:AAA family ATPase [Mycobacteroides abscessus]MDO3334054.1 AAA family ATPase [Mycobacteroides abscessus subsp. bolletii]
MDTITYDEHVARLRRLRDDDAVRDDEHEFRAAVRFFDFDKFVKDEDVQRVWDRQEIDTNADEEADEAEWLHGAYGFMDLTTDRADGRPAKARHWLYPKLLLPAQYHNITAPSATGKSGLGLDLSVQMVLGITQLGMEEHDTLQTGTRVLYIDRENPLETIERRFQLMPYEGRDDVWKRLFYRRNPTLPMLDTPEGGEALLHMALQCRVHVVVIDTKSKFVEGPSEKDYTEHRFYNYTVNPLKDAGIAVVVIDHTNLTDLSRPSGSGAKTDNVDALWVITKAKEQPRDKNLTDLIMTERKERGIGMPKTVYVRRKSDPYHHTLSLDNPRKAGLHDYTLVLDTEGHTRELLKAKYPDGNVGINEGYAYLKDQGVKGDTTKLKAVVRSFKEETGGLN